MTHRRIDVHQHFVPAVYADWLRQLGIHDAGGRALPAWSADEALRLMDDHDIATAILSISTPGVHLDPSRRVDPVARSRARQLNELGARLAADHPQRFGYFATVP